MGKIIISGKFVRSPINGISRYATEVVKAIDRKVSPEQMELIVPAGMSGKLKLNNIKIIEGKTVSLGWDYSVVEKYAKQNNALYVNFCNNGGFYKKSIVCVHDIRPLTWGDGKRTFKTQKLKMKLYISSWLAVKNTKILVTLSEFSKHEIQDYFNRNDKEIEVISCGWEHLNAIFADDNIIKKNPYLTPKEYYFSISSIAPHKNFSWVLKIAQRHPECQFVIAGNKNGALWATELSFSEQNNIHYLGYVTDEEMKSLMSNSKALLFPSFYEGFGIPPLEALALGVPAIVSDIPIMREIFGNSVYYINPHDDNVSLNDLLSQRIAPADELLEKNSWSRAADKWLSILLEHS